MELLCVRAEVREWLAASSGFLSLCTTKLWSWGESVLLNVPNSFFVLSHMVYAILSPKHTSIRGVIIHFCFTVT